MYTATITNKEETFQGLRLTVDFSDGVKTITEQVIPQDEAGLKHWINSRLVSLNSIEEIDLKYTTGVPVDLSEPEIVKTPAELEKEAWLIDYSRWVRVKEMLVDTGVVPLNNAKVQALLTKVQNGLKPEYLDSI